MRFTKWLRSVFRRDRNLDNVLKRQIIQVRMICVEHATRIDTGEHYDTGQIRRVLTDIAHALMAVEGTIDESLGIPPWWESKGKPIPVTQDPNFRPPHVIDAGMGP